MQSSQQTAASQAASEEFEKPKVLKDPFSKIEQRNASFMKPVTQDPMRKREEFAISLRKQKKDQIIRERRKRLMLTARQQSETQEGMEGEEESKIEEGQETELDLTKQYRGCPFFIEEVGHDPDLNYSLKEILARILPDYPKDVENEQENYEQTCEVKLKQVQQLLAILFGSNDTNMSQVDQLALVVTLRYVVSTSDLAPIEEIAKNTQLILNIKAMANWLNDQVKKTSQMSLMDKKVIYCFEQEIGWIAINVANGPTDVVINLLFEVDEQNQHVPCEALFSFLKRSLLSNRAATEHNALYFTANAMAESANIAHFMFSQLDLFATFYKIVFEEKPLPGLLDLVMWNMAHLARFDVLKPIYDDKSKGQLLRTMLRSCLSIVNNLGLTEDTLNATKEVIDKASDTFKQSFFDEATVLSLMKLFDRVKGQNMDYATGLVLRILGDMSSTANVQVGLETFLRQGGLDKANQAVLTGDKGFAIDALWLLSNIACDNADFAYRVANHDVLDTVVDKMEHSIDFQVKKECFIIIGNLLTCLSLEHLSAFLDYHDNLLRTYLAGHAMISEFQVVTNILATIETFAIYDEQQNLTGANSFKGRLELAGGLEVIEELQKMPNEFIYKKTVEILTNYFELEQAEMECMEPERTVSQPTQEQQVEQNRFMI